MQICSNYSSNRCRSCSLMELGENAAATKERTFREHFREFKSLVTHQIVTPGQIFPSRSKVKIQVTGSVDAPILGLVDNALRGVELLDCPLHLPVLNRALTVLKGMITELRLHPYQIKERTGELKAIHLITNQSQSELIIRFILRSKSLEKRLASALKIISNRIPEVRVVSLNFQPIAHALFEGNEETVLSVQQTIVESYFGRNVLIGPRSFVQVTPEIAQSLYSEAANMVGNVSGVLDLFCGNGGFSFFIAPKAKWVLGVELSEGAIFCAEQGAQLNGISNATFRAADVERFLGTYEGERPQLIVVNPPRRGLSEAIIAGIKRLSPERVIYSSCNPETLLRDLRSFGDEYRPRAVRPFDMFPLTDHLEVLVELTKN